MRWLLGLSGLRAARDLLSARPRAPLCGSGVRPPEDTKYEAALLSDASASFLAQLERLGPPSSADKAPLDDLRDILKSTDTLFASGSTAVRPYDPDKLGLLSKEHSTVDVLPLLDADTRALLDDPEKNILIADADLVRETLESTPFYTDPALADEAVMIDLVIRLYYKGLVCHQKLRRARVGLFFVLKK